MDSRPAIAFLSVMALGGEKNLGGFASELNISKKWLELAEPT